MLATAPDDAGGPRRRQDRPSRAFRAAVIGLLGLHVLLLGWGAARHTPSIDEVGFLAAGISHWTCGSFDLYRVNPPLVRMLGTLPVVLCRPRTDWSRYAVQPLTRSEYDIGADFAEANRDRIMWYFTMARWACLPLSLLGGIVCLRWATDLYGRAAGLFALVLWSFCPNVLAHGQALAPDMGATALGVATMYLFWRWLREPGWGRAPSC